MIQWVVDAACASNATAVLVATDDARIANAVANPRGTEPIAVMTSAAHASGTDRIAEVARRLQWPDDLIVVNVQGDEPQMPAVLIDQVADLLLRDADAAIATLSTPIASMTEFMNPNVVKVVSDDKGRALYFSRAPIPWDRDSAGGDLASQSSHRNAHRHLGIYAYRVGALLALTALPAGSLEQIEMLEQLRAMQAGMKICVAIAKVLPGIGVDTPADLATIQAVSRSPA